MKNINITKTALRNCLVLCALMIGTCTATYGQLIINEVLADPASDAPGDANGDGTRSASDDEFIEFVNIGTSPLDVSGWQVLDTNSQVLVRHIFPDNTIIPARKALVLFGGGTPTGDFGGSIVQTASSGSLGISNTSEMLMVVNVAEDTVILLGWDDFNNDMAWTRSPELTGSYLGHSSVKAEVLFSPGTKADGAAFTFDLLVINEVLADPAADAPGDANGDGTRSASDDEFIEFVNMGTSSLDVSGWQILDTNSQVLVRHVFPEESVIPPMGVLVVFGGGTPTGDFGGSMVQTASSGSLGLSNADEMLMIVDGEEDTIIQLGYLDWNGDASFVRSPEYIGDFALHSTVEASGGALFSPGTKTDGGSFVFDQLVINEVLADPANDAPGDANGDGIRSASDDEFIEFVNKGLTDLDISGWQILDTNSQVLVRHVFPDHSVIPAGKALVVFGGGVPTGDFGGSIVQLASTGSLGISNTSEELRVVNFTLDTLIILGYADFNSDMSHTRDPDITGEFVQHSTANGSAGALFSPGKRVDGSPFEADGLKLVVNEVLADPANDAPGDANGDGTRSASDDEFIEFVNKGAVELDISGWQVLDTNSQLLVRHIFPDNTIIPPGGALVVFGGGTPAGTFGNSIVQTASSGTLGISNSSEQLLIVDGNEDTVIVVNIPDWGTDESYTLNPDIIGSNYVGHSGAGGSGGALFSPGTRVDGSFFIVPDATIVQFLAGGVGAKEGDGSFEIEVSITAPSASVATTVELALTTGDPAQLDGYTTTTLTFAAGSSESQSVTINITDDDVVEPTDTLVFVLQNVAGGEGAVLGEGFTFMLILSDNDFAATTLVINEFLAWPAGQDGSTEVPPVDANGDGVAHFEDDEFIEFVNSGTNDIDISGWKVYDEVTGNDPLRHVFPDGTVINPGGALVVFGGGNPTGEFGGSPTMIASQANQGLGMTNSGDAIIVKNASDETVIEFPFGQQVRSTSITLSPDITGSPVEHPLLNELNISPGTKIDGSPFEIPTRTEVKFAVAGGGINETGGSYQIALAITRPSDIASTTARVILTSIGAEGDLTFTTQLVTFAAGSSDNKSVSVTILNDSEVEGDELFIFKIDSVGGGENGAIGSPSTFELAVVDDDASLIFNEVFASPSGNSGDANNDGEVSAVQDEFIELINTSEETMDMSGWTFEDASGVRHVFDANTKLSPGTAMVVFGGGVPVGFANINFQLASSQDLSLDDMGDSLTIYNTSGQLMARTIYGALAGSGQSITRDPDITGGFVLHSSVAGVDALFSPGTRTNGSPFASTILGLNPNKAHIYPNPVQEWLSVSAEEAASISFYALNGGVISKIDLNEKKSSRLDVSNFPKGLYLYEIISKDGIVLEKGKVIFTK
ncbi:MAG: lamin tail domain-containing protein [Marinoscillum sp.]